jgi:hypothetical protein
MESAKKGSAHQVENIAEDGFEKTDPVFDAATKGQGVTGYEALGVRETIKTFKLCTLVCFMMAFSAATDGYQIGYVILREEQPHLLLLKQIYFLESTPVSSQTKALLHALLPLLEKTESLPLHRPSSVAGAQLCPAARLLE